MNKNPIVFILDKINYVNIYIVIYLIFTVLMIFSFFE